MPGRARIRARLLVVGVCAVFAGVATTSGGAETPTSAHRAQTLRDANASLASRARSASLELYAIESQLARARSSLASLQAQQARVEQQRAAVRAHLSIARENLHSSQRQLAMRVHLLYEQQAVDPVAVVLGAQSLDDVLTTLDDLDRTALQDKQVAAQSSHAATSLFELSHALAQEDARISSLASEAARTASALSTARTTKQGFISRLAAQRRLNNAQIASYERRAQAQVALNASLTAAASTAAPAVSPPPAVPGNGRTLTVSATGYALSGTTASGVPVGWGVVAVDPGVIPLGTHMTIPGYGEGVAADTGSAVRGATIDLWFPTVAQALAWGRRTVTITLH